MLGIYSLIILTTFLIMILADTNKTTKHRVIMILLSLPAMAFILANTETQKVIMQALKAMKQFNV